jgi:hypothetical protein
MGSRYAFDRRASNSNSTGVSVSRGRLRRAREKRGRTPQPPSPALIAPQTSVPAGPDPVRVAVLAMERFGRASMRACFTGAEVCVAVPDAATAAIFEAAIAETARSRATDRLIRIVID